MSRARSLFTSTALALILVSSPVLAQDNTTESGSAAVSATYQVYASALVELQTGIANGTAATAQFAAAQAARAELMAVCAEAGTPELAVCLDTHIAGEMRVEGDVAPLPEAPAVDEQPLETVEEAVEPATEEQAASEQPTEPEAAPAEPEAEPSTEEAPEAEPQVEPVSDGAEVQAAYAAYIDARTVLREATEAGGDVTAAAQQVNIAFDGVLEACEMLGTPDLAECLDLYVSSDARIENDLTRVEVTGAPVDEEAEAEAPNPEDVAPVLDSEKEVEAETGVETDTSAEAEPAQDAEPAPQSDEEAQAEAQTEEMQPSNAEQGEEISEEEGREATSQSGAPEQAQVVEQNNFRIVFRFGDQLVVRNQDNSRIGYDAEDTRYERLGNGRYRETIYRINGSQLITIYNRNGDILQRSVIEPDGNEYFLVYTPEDRYEDVLQWRDPAQDLPPLHLTIPANEYVLDARSADQQRIYDFLGQPPVERIDRYYSVDEVKRSARLRDVMRRLEIGDLTFATGSAALSAEQYGSLSIVANAMQQLLSDYPGEVFLIEGHTDAVGSDISNLSLSDRRAESVAVVLTQTFGIPPENLVTQGYGERYLAVRTEGPERLNRRVSGTRITPLVAPRTAAAG